MHGLADIATPAKHRYGEHLYTLVGHTGPVGALAVGVDGKIFTGSVDRTIWVWSDVGAVLHRQTLTVCACVRVRVCACVHVHVCGVACACVCTCNALWRLHMLPVCCHIHSVHVVVSDIGMCSLRRCSHCRLLSRHWLLAKTGRSTRRLAIIQFACGKAIT